MEENTESFYDGGYSSLNSTWGNFTGYQEKTPATIGFPGSPFTADQLGEAVKVVKSGAKVFEVTFLGPPTGDREQTAPVQHLKEIRALTRLTGIKPSVHGPLVDPAGFDGRRGWGKEDEIENSKRRMWDAIERAHVIDPDSNIPVVFHTSNGVPGNEYMPDDTKKPGEEGRFILKRATAVNQDTGQVVPLERDTIYYPSFGSENLKKGITREAEDKIDSINQGEWENKLTELATLMKNSNEIIYNPVNSTYLKNFLSPDIENFSPHAEFKKDPKDGKVKVFDPKSQTFKDSIQLQPEQMAASQDMRRANIFLENTKLMFNNAFEKAYKFAYDKDQKEELEKFSDEYTRQFIDYKNMGGDNQVVGVKYKAEILQNAIDRLAQITSKPDKENEKTKVPQVYKDTETFAMDKATTTFAEIAAKAYDRFGDKSPVLAIENIDRERGAFSRGEDMVKFISETRNKFKKELIEKHNLSEKNAEEVAKKQIGVTWDVGHINMIRKDGFTEEDVVEQIKAVAKDPSMVKHLHITDNFGFNDSHLPPGMGNVPIKKQLEVLEKTGRIHEMKKIMEAGGFIEQFKASPVPHSYAAFGSGIYNRLGDSTEMMVSRNYFGGFGLSNPAMHQSLYGAGFTTLPADLGGNIAGMSRFSGNRME